MDLHNWNFKKNGIIKLDGEWEFYWKQFLEPQDFKNKKETSGLELIQVPGRWNTIKVKGKKIGSYGYATYRMIIKAFESNSLMGIKIQRIYTSYKIWVNNKLLGEHGRIGKTKKTSAPRELPKLFYFYPDEEKINRGEIEYKHNHIIDLSQFILEKVKMYKVVAMQKNIDLVYTIEENCFIKSDHAAIERIINNLFSNALNYTGHNGAITITLKNAGDKIIAAIQDTGIGIPEHQLEKIFLPYYKIPNNKSTIQGTGIGLYIVKEIIKSLGGEIKVKSEPGKGTKFTIILNKYFLLEGEKTEKKRKCTSPTDKQEKTVDIIKDSQHIEEKNTILLVEDNSELLAFLMDELSIIYNIYYARNGYEALNKLHRIPKPDIIISDIMMDKMDGLHLYAVIQENTMFNDIPLIFLTAKTSEKDRITGLKKGAIDYICKPFSLPELKAKIKTIIANKKKIKKSGMHEAIIDMKKNIEIFKNRIKDGGKKQDMDYYNIKYKCKDARPFFISINNY